MPPEEGSNLASDKTGVPNSSTVSVGKNFAVFGNSLLKDQLDTPRHAFGSSSKIR
jgi:hypothetical protein